jgi:pyruvate dehydrogenase E2 component (dihydrolipoamide acetyltransferase)
VTMIAEVKVPDIGGATEVEVIEVSVKPGDTVAVEQALITLEGDKATMEIPSPFAGKIVSVQVKVGDKLSEGDLFITMEVASENASDVAAQEVTIPADPATAQKSEAVAKKVLVPDIGGGTDVDVIQVSIAVGDEVNKEDALITLEGEKATMDIPSPFAGKVTEVLVAVGAKVSEGDPIAVILTASDAAAVTVHAAAQGGTAQSSGSQSASTQSGAGYSAPAAHGIVAPASASAVMTQPHSAGGSASIQPLTPPGANVHASPGVRRIAREFGVDLRLVRGSGPKARILKQDVQAYVRGELAKPRGGSGIEVMAAPKIDFAKFGAIEVKPLNKIKKFTGANVHRSWVTIPHVTQFGEADITALEILRKQQNTQAAELGVKLTPLVYIMKVVVASMKAYPLFNSSLDESGENLVMKKYFHIGIAVDTPNGLVVPVVRDVDQKDIYTLASELATISTKAREKGLTPVEMAGSCFTISSLGGIGGTAFTPIVKAPDVAILGVSRSAMKPVYENGAFVPRMMLPLSLSYDHRVIDGADGARFIVDLANRLTDIEHNWE